MASNGGRAQWWTGCVTRRRALRDVVVERDRDARARADRALGRVGRRGGSTVGVGVDRAMGK
jgi:hypothetical protein